MQDLRWHFRQAHQVAGGSDKGEHPAEALAASSVIREHPRWGFALRSAISEQAEASWAGQHRLWRAMNQNGHVLGIPVQSRRNAWAAERFFRKLLRGLQHAPRVIATDKLGSYGAAKRKALPGLGRRQSRRLDNPARIAAFHTRRKVAGTASAAWRPDQPQAFDIAST